MPGSKSGLPRGLLLGTKTKEPRLPDGREISGRGAEVGGRGEGGGVGAGSAPSALEASKPDLKGVKSQDQGDFAKVGDKHPSELLPHGTIPYRRGSVRKEGQEGERA